jgi:hypothetical protein
MLGFGLQLVRGHFSLFFSRKINSEPYMRLILSPFFGQLTDEEKSYWHFMQESGTAHTTNNSIVALDEVFG